MRSIGCGDCAAAETMRLWESAEITGYGEYGECGDYRLWRVWRVCGYGRLWETLETIGI